jgi:hypothetical protein
VTESQVRMVARYGFIHSRLHGRSPTHGRVDSGFSSC